MGGTSVASLIKRRNLFSPKSGLSPANRASVFAKAETGTGYGFPPHKRRRVYHSPAALLLQGLLAMPEYFGISALSCGDDKRDLDTASSSQEAKAGVPRPLPKYPDQARAFVDACASVGATHFYLTFRPLEPLDPNAARDIVTIGGGYHSVTVSREKLHAWIKRGAERQQSVILRPFGDVLRIDSTLTNGRRTQKAIRMPFGDRRGVLFFQLDDIGDRDQDGSKIQHSDDRTREIVERLRPATLFTIRTSPKSLQLWIAIRKAEFTSEADRIAYRARLVAGCNADVPASCATRIPGSVNYKQKYGEDHGEDYGIEYPVVRCDYMAHETIASRSVLEFLGVLAAPNAVPETTKQRVEISARCSVVHAPRWPWKDQEPERYPSYKIALQNAPRRSDGLPDGSKADISWAWRAINRAQWTLDDAFAYLLQESIRASEWLSTRGAQAWERECRRTVQYAQNGDRTT